MGNSMAGQSGGSNNVKIQNFLEALRNSQTSRESIENRPGKNIFAEIQAKKEIEKRRIEQFQSQRNQEWNGVFSAKEAQKAKRIEEIHEQLRQLSKQLKRLDINLKKAVETPIVDYGEYQESYLEHLKNRLHLYSLNVNSANSWLEVYQNRSRKQGAYWGMANSKGSSYTQNNERSIATSVG
jgi:hypothetical protein